jgi:hypothetical protein
LNFGAGNRADSCPTAASAFHRTGALRVRFSAYASIGPS